VTLDAPVRVGSEESPVIRWLMTDGRRMTDAKSFLEHFAACLIEAGVDVSRITTGVPVLHPQLFSYSGLWERGKGVTERLKPFWRTVRLRAPTRVARFAAD
jgi:adenylate cyclase